MLPAKRPKPKKDRSKPKKIKTYSSSEFSLLEDRNHHSMTELYRHEALKKKAPQPVPKKVKSQKIMQTTLKKRTKSKSKIKLDKCETYELIPFKSSLNSQIAFSNEETKREASFSEHPTGRIAIRIRHDYPINTRTSRQTLPSKKNETQLRTEAAVKIQKVFRGFLTRKILQKYIQFEQKQISQKIAQRRSESVSEHSSYFGDREVYIEPRRKLPVDQVGVFQYSHHESEENSDSEGEMEHAVYRHHEPIYSQDEISGYLESSSQEDDFNRDAYEHHIIFQTNEEYIDSRKSSSQHQQPRNKLSKAGHSEPIAEEQYLCVEKPVQQEKVMDKTEKRQSEWLKGKLEEEQEEIKDQTLKINEDSKSRTRIHQIIENLECAATFKSQDGLLKYSGSKMNKTGSKQFMKLKQAEVNRWNEIIGVVQSQIGTNLMQNNEISEFMRQILQISTKNKELLEQQNQAVDSLADSAISSEYSMSRRGSIDMKSIKVDRQYLLPTQNPKQKIVDSIKKEDPSFQQPLVAESPLKSLQNPEQIKKLFAKNRQDEQIEEIFKLKEQLTKQRQTQQMKKLKEDVDNKIVSEIDSLYRLKEIKAKYAAERIDLEKAKDDISKGFRAALKLTSETYSDAVKLGYNLPLSRSMEGLRYKKSIMLNDIIIDELTNPKRDKKPLKEEVEKKEIKLAELSFDEENSDEFTEEELSRFRKAYPFDIKLAEEIADMGRNMTISEQMMKQQEIQQKQEELAHKEPVYRQTFIIEQSSPAPIDHNKQTLAEDIFMQIIWQLTGEILIKPLFSERLINRNQFNKPSTVSDKEKLRFIALLEQHFPSVEKINEKLNQKICPLPNELLKCMRIDFSEEEDENSYEEIGKYQFIIGQEVCNEAIQVYKHEIETNNPVCIPSVDALLNLTQKFTFNQRVIRYVEQRQKYLANRKNHTKELRWQVLNIEVHCIFDAWNEQLIYLRNQKAGYSGIGLNELTLSMIDHNTVVPMHETMSLLEQGRKRLIRSLSISSPSISFPAKVQQTDKQLLDIDSKWIFYADEALSYGLQLGYLIEQQIFGQMAKQLRKRKLIFF